MQKHEEIRNPHREQVAKIILYMVSSIGILPAAIIGTQYFNITQPVLSDISTWLTHPAIPAVFTILFALGAGLSTYLAKKWFIILLLPLIYLAIVPLFANVDQQKVGKDPFFYYGQTKPGKGFKHYKKMAWTIKIDYPEHIKKRIKSSGKKPIILTSLGGKSRQWEALGFNSIYPYNYPDNQKKEPANWWEGFSLYLQERNHRHNVQFQIQPLQLQPQKKSQKTSAVITTSPPPNWPVNYQWFVSYVLVIPED